MLIPVLVGTSVYLLGGGLVVRALSRDEDTVVGELLQTVEPGPRGAVLLAWPLLFLLWGVEHTLTALGEWVAE